MNEVSISSKSFPPIQKVETLPSWQRKWISRGACFWPDRHCRGAVVFNRAITLTGIHMALLGTAALAMWWNMASDMRAEFEDWHSHEHFPERLGIPGFQRCSRWTSASKSEGIFVMYELTDYKVLSSQPYLARLNAPTPWSTKLMPHHRDMVRGQCHVLETRGGAIA